VEYFKKIFKYAKPFKKYIYLNIFFNILYALFSALSFLSLMPMLEVLFGENIKLILNLNLMVFIVLGTI
jgi:subfamily B ATP-binding cassette protein MsbA